MTYLVYLDEQEGEIDGEVYTAVIGFRVRVDDIIKIRAQFYPRYNEILDRRIRGDVPSESRHIHRMPDLHGSNLLREYDDDVKFKVLDALIASLDGIDCDFLRIGYFNRSFPPEINFNSRDRRLDHAITSVGFAILDKPDEYHLLVSEFDKEALRRRLDTTYSSLSLYFAAGAESASFNLPRLVGHYRASKSELGCQIADVINYCCLKSSNPRNEFAARMSRYYEAVAEKYLVNQIIWVNDEDRTRQFRQKNPVSTGLERRITDPLRRIVRIIPNDDVLVTEEIPPVR
ncbi:hypothetical protein U5903_07150 [Cereibacter johrii]|uniref:hypothetical protein n=1 Tax=Cereibacter johrii TaxID=445629 RepID=UPI002B25E688|nr:hypothetical protein [Cereibacter johrii]MEA5160550.1 hypothetical protein [Cereibacter johrii]